MSEGKAGYDVDTPDYYYAQSADWENWQCDDIQEVADSQCIDMHEIIYPDKPSTGLEVSVWRGESEPITMAEVLPNLHEYISERLYEYVDDSESFTTASTNLQYEFQKWASSEITINVFRIINIVEIKLVFDGKKWVEKS